MAKVKATNSSGSPRRGRPALTPEARENQLISLAVDLVEQRLLDGSASAQETTHFLKLATRKAKLEAEILEKQAKLIDAKTEALESNKRMEELYAQAISAMQVYGGHMKPPEEEMEYDDEY